LAAGCWFLDAGFWILDFCNWKYVLSGFEPNREWVPDISWFKRKLFNFTLKKKNKL